MPIMNVEKLLASTGTRLRKLDPIKVEELAQSIKEIGMINAPITNNGKLVAGLHRVAAHQLLGRGQVVVTEMGNVNDPDSLTLIEIDENLFRNELSPSEKAAHITQRVNLLTKKKLQTKTTKLEVQNQVQAQNDNSSDVSHKKRQHDAKFVARSEAIKEVSEQLNATPSSINSAIRKHKAVESAGLAQEDIVGLTTAQFNRVAKVAAEKPDEAETEVIQQMVKSKGEDLLSHDPAAALKRTRKRLLDARSIAKTNQSNDEQENLLLHNIMEAVTAWVEYIDSREE
ncbi:ParB N-terminal domain-containing protein [Vibrio sp. 10N.261.52.A1]|uniref:ParB N-terminal domain-containing protein n=1 Tax=Vibrio TaxID=662 RepID=UPI000C85DBB0|nr:ParB N-terminal domain-containing protein [Vibrio sp. 10N.261.52.A1]PML35131.1 hypothetical protein BCT81_19095 [Vibrio sp. 10N.261.52.A1]